MAAPHNDLDPGCGCRQCKMADLCEEIVTYMFTAMEPTDRALRPAGYPPATC